MVSIGNLYFDFQYAATVGEKFRISNKSKIKYESEKYAGKYARKTLDLFCADGIEMTIELFEEIPSEISQSIGDKYVANEEEYIIEISSQSKKINLYAQNHRGLLYAISTLHRLCSSDEIRDMILYDYPAQKVRGYRVYTPGREFIDDFKNMIDTLVYYKYNALIIEVGGAMEYKKHPVINQKWVEYCNEVGQGPDEAWRIVALTYPWAKDSIHFENGNGGYITREEMRGIVDYCRERDIDIYPEVPSLSHSDYIVRAYPELNERKEDEYPDTYCPSNPKTYEVLFDIIDEVAEVFEPEFINIGHDEFYTAGKCKLCKRKSPVDIYVDDVVKIRDYLASKNIKTVMWGEKLYSNLKGPFDLLEEAPLGGAANPLKDIPPLFKCKYKLPKDVTLLNWCWSISDKKDDKEIYDLGFKMLFGNYNPIYLNDYRERSKVAEGGFVSNWGSIEPMYCQRNGYDFSIAATAYIFWNTDYTEEMREELIERTKRELYDNYKNTLGADIIEIEHNADFNREHKPFYCGTFIVDEDWHIGNHRVTYTDGTEELLPVIFGYNIRNAAPGCTEDEYKLKYNANYIEAAGASYPYFKDGEIVYRTAYKNPHPGKTIKSIRYESVNGVEAKILGQIVES